jgi:hypothetical protein
MLFRRYIILSSSLNSDAIHINKERTLDPDYDSLDPQERTNKYMAIISAALGFISLFAGLIPICGSLIGLVGIGAGYFGRKSEHRKMATIGIVLSSMGIITSLTYMILASLKK